MAVERIVNAAKFLAAVSLVPLGLFVYDRFGPEEQDAEFLFGVLFISADVTLLIWLIVWAARLPKSKEPPERIPGDW